MDPSSKIAQFDRIYECYTSEIFKNTLFGGLVGAFAALLIPSRKSLAFTKIIRKGLGGLCVGSGTCAGLTTLRYQTYYDKQKKTTEDVEISRWLCSSLYFDFFRDSYKQAKAKIIGKNK